MTRGASGHAAGKHSAASRFFYSHHRPNSLAAFVAVLLFVLAALLAIAPSGAAEQVVLTDAALAGVTGQAGLSISTDMSIRFTASVWKISDTSSTPQWLELQNITVDDGNGGYFHAYAPLTAPETVDIGSNDSGRTLVAFLDTSQVLPRWYSVGNFVLCNQSLGSLNLDALSVGPSLLRYGTHTDGTGGGFDFDYTTSVTAQAFRYTYNTVPGILTLSGIHLAYQADVLGKNGTGDNPADPTTWAFTGANNVFRIGDIVGGNPAKFDVVTDTTTWATSLFLTLPMQGTLRVEDVKFGGNDFGPIAIDGINVHHLIVKISP